MPLVSIVTPVYNGARFLEALVDSVRSQTYPHIEHIVIDDGSTDGGATRAILARYPHLRSWSRPNRGQYASLNEGFAAASGEILTTISADDYYVNSRAVSAAVSHFNGHQECDLVLGMTRWVDETGEPFEPQPYQQFPFWMLPYNPFVSHCSLFLRRARVPEHTLRFDESFKFRGDADWSVRIYRAGCRYCRINTEIAAYRSHRKQATSLAVADPVIGARVIEEQHRFNEMHVRSKVLKVGVDSYVTLQRRRVKAVAALRRGGLKELRRLINGWHIRD